MQKFSSFDIMIAGVEKEFPFQSMFSSSTPLGR
nr:MAG TPA: hypothetical protein [Caudoviricetes sp.]